MIDSHHHFWRYNGDEYGWIDDRMAVLRRDFLPSDLADEIQLAGVDGVISVQARQTLEETRWLINLAARHDFIQAVVGWVPLVDREVPGQLEALAQFQKFKGVRHVVQDEPDDDFLLRDEFCRGVSHLARYGLTYDLLIYARQLPQAVQFADRFPHQTLVLDHLAKPPIREGGVKPWRGQLLELARRPNVYCKVSGMVTEADWHRWTPEELKVYFDVALASFGPARLMFGSDWPVCLVACDYRRWFELVTEWTSSLTPDERHHIFGGTARQAYGLAG